MVLGMLAQVFKPDCAKRKNIMKNTSNINQKVVKSRMNSWKKIYILR